MGSRFYRRLPEHARGGCQHGWAVGRIFKDICKKAKLPVLILNADIMDQRHMPEKEIMREITEFFRSTGLA